MAEPQYVVIAGFPNADFMAVALDKDGVAISEKTFKPIARDGILLGGLSCT